MSKTKCEAHGDECSPVWEDYWPKFVEGMQTRFRAGHVEYSDKVFSKDPSELILEILQEAEDIIGWGFILRYRLQKVKDQFMGGAYPHSRALEMLESCRGQNEKLVQANIDLRYKNEQMRVALQMCRSVVSGYEHPSEKHLPIIDGALGGTHGSDQGEAVEG